MLTQIPAPTLRWQGSRHHVIDGNVADLPELTPARKAQIARRARLQNRIVQLREASRADCLQPRQSLVFGDGQAYIKVTW